MLSVLDGRSVRSRSNEFIREHVRRVGLHADMNAIVDRLDGISLRFGSSECGRAVPSGGGTPRSDNRDTTRTRNRVNVSWEIHILGVPGRQANEATAGHNGGSDASRNGSHDVHRGVEVQQEKHLGSDRY